MQLNKTSIPLKIVLEFGNSGVYRMFSKGVVIYEYTFLYGSYIILKNSQMGVAIQPIHPSGPPLGNTGNKVVQKKGFDFLKKNS